MLPRVARHAVRLIALPLLLSVLGPAACSSEPTSVAGHTAGDTSGPGVTAEPGPSASGSDAGDATASASDGAAPDATSPPTPPAPAPLAPHPPPGATPCGAGSFSLADAVAECNAGATWFSGSVKPGPCGGLVASGGEWQAWCTATETYSWIRFKEVASASTPSPGACAFWMPMPMHRSGNAGGSLGSDAVNGFVVEGDASQLTPSPRDVVVFATRPRATKTTLYLAATPGAGAPGCIDLAPASYLFLGFALP